MKSWVGLAAFVTAYDVWAAVTDNNTLSADYAQAAREHPAVVAVCTAYMAIHLWGYWPRKIDPLCQAIDATGRVYFRVWSARQDSNLRPAG